LDAKAHFSSPRLYSSALVGEYIEEKPLFVPYNLDQNKRYFKKKNKPDNKELAPEKELHSLSQARASVVKHRLSNLAKGRKSPTHKHG
jgi:hypothetical protein